MGVRDAGLTVAGANRLSRSIREAIWREQGTGKVVRVVRVLPSWAGGRCWRLFLRSCSGYSVSLRLCGRCGLSHQFGGRSVQGVDVVWSGQVVVESGWTVKGKRRVCALWGPGLII